MSDFDIDRRDPLAAFMMILVETGTAASKRKRDVSAFRSAAPLRSLSG
ncbi:hypothetical protein [Sphingomonas profundi]|nr:hypothetical protein [Sphingomonas profundi]